MHAISSYRGNRPTNKQTNKQTGAITMHCAAASLVRSVTRKTLDALLVVTTLTAIYNVLV